MKVQATTTMTKELNKYFKANNIPFNAVYESMSENAYKWYVSTDIWDNEADYIPQSGKMRAIKIYYPDNYYATPRYLTSRDLVRVFRKSDKTFNGFMKDLYDDIAV